MPRRSSSSELVDLDPEIDCTYHNQLRGARNIENIELVEENLASEESEVESNTRENNMRD